MIGEIKFDLKKELDKTTPEEWAYIANSKPVQDLQKRIMDDVYLEVFGKLPKPK